MSKRNDFLITVYFNNGWVYCKPSYEIYDEDFKTEEDVLEYFETESQEDISFFVLENHYDPDEIYPVYITVTKHFSVA